MRIRVFQIQQQHGEKALLSMQLQHLGYYQIRKFCGGRIDETLYGIVFDGELEADSAESVYRNLSRHLPEGFNGHTMFQSDIVEIVDTGETGARPGFYFANENGSCTFLSDFDPARIGNANLNDEKLHPCYFCGGAVKIVEKAMTGYSCEGCFKYYIECSCGLLVTFRGCDTASSRCARAELIRRWNKESK